MQGTWSLQDIKGYIELWLMTFIFPNNVLSPEEILLLIQNYN